MKKNSVCTLLSVLFLLNYLASFGQSNTNDKWFVDVNVGPTVFIGDIRSSDYFPSFKKPVEIGFGFGVIFGKELGDYFNVRSQVNLGGINGVKPISDYNFKSKFISIGLGAELNLKTLFMGNSRSNLQAFGTFGATYVAWDADLYKTSTSVVFDSDKSAAIGIPLGLKISYELSRNLFLDLEGMLIVVTSDFVDAKEGGITHDDINYNYLGLTYKLEKHKKRRKPLSRSQIVQAKPIIEKPISEEINVVKEAVEQANPIVEIAKVDEVKAAEMQAIKNAETIVKEENDLMEKVIAQETRNEILGIHDLPVNYKVSVFSSKNQKDPLLLQKELGIPELVSERSVGDGSYNYLVGSFDKLWKAKDLKNRLITQNNIKQAKVVLCKNGESMSLRQAYDLAVVAQQNNDLLKEYSNAMYEAVTLTHTIPTEGLVIGVQILSVKKEAYPVQLIKDLYEIENEIFVDKSIGAWSKFVVNRFSSFEEADNAKEVLRKKGFFDAFVVAYYDGQRIPPSKIAEYLKK
jgi:hypothetical protein